MSEQSQVTPQQAVHRLNEILSLDPEALAALVGNRVPCNKALAEHPTVQVHLNPDGSFEVGLLGILNGIFGTRPDGWGWIVATGIKKEGDLLYIESFQVLSEE